MAGRVTKNAIKGKQGFQRTGRADPLEAASLGIPSSLLSMVKPPSAPVGYSDVHLAYEMRIQRPNFVDAKRASLRHLEDTRLIARDPETSSETLDYIAQKTDDAVALSSVARHENTSAATLHKMAMRLDHNDYESVICRIGERKIASPETMQLIATSSSEKVKVWAAWHDNTPAECHVDFRDSRNAAVRQGSAENPGNTAEVLFYLGNALYEGDGPCRTAAKSNRNYPSVEDRIALARSASTPILEREMLAWDANAKVRKAAKEYFGKSRPTSEELETHARERGFPSHIAEGIARRKMLLEDKTAGVADS